MRVLMLSKACVVGVYQRKLEEMAQLPDVELRVLVPPVWRDPDRGPMPLERLHVSGYDLRTTPIRFNGHFHLHYYPELGKQVRAFKPDIVHIDEEPYNLATWHALRQAKKVGAKSLFFSWQNIPRDYPPPFRIMEKSVLKRVDYAIMGTESAAVVWRDKGYRGPLDVIPQFGVDPAIYAPLEHPRQGGTFKVGYAGRLVLEKGVHVLLDALSSLDGLWQLDIVGDGPEKNALTEKAKRLRIADRVFFGSIPAARMPAYYQSLDVLVLPSLTRPNWKEQFGRVIIEAMACGVPVVGSSSGDIPHVIGEAGFIFEEGQVDELVDVLRRLARDVDLRRDYSARGRLRVLEHYTQEKIAAQTIEVYHKMQR